MRRDEIVGDFLESLEREPENGVEAAWRQEIVDRVAALESGNVEMIPWEEVRDGFVLRLREYCQR